MLVKTQPSVCCITCCLRITCFLVLVAVQGQQTTTNVEGQHIPTSATFRVPPFACATGSHQILPRSRPFESRPLDNEMLLGVLGPCAAPGHKSVEKNTPAAGAACSLHRKAFRTHEVPARIPPRERDRMLLGPLSLSRAHPTRVHAPSLREAETSECLSSCRSLWPREWGDGGKVVPRGDDITCTVGCWRGAEAARGGWKRGNCLVRGRPGGLTRVPHESAVPGAARDLVRVIIRVIIPAKTSVPLAARSPQHWPLGSAPSGGGKGVGGGGATALGGGRAVGQGGRRLGGWDPARRRARFERRRLRPTACSSGSHLPHVGLCGGRGWGQRSRDRERERERGAASS